MILRELAQRFSQQEYVAAEVGFFDESIGPDLLHQVVLGDDLLVMPDENEQHLECFGRQVNGIIRTQQELPFGVHTEGT